MSMFPQIDAAFWRLTHLGRVAHMRVSKLATICLDNGLSCCRRQNISLTNSAIVLIWSLGTNLSVILIDIFVQENAFKTILPRPQCVNHRSTWCISVAREIY